MMQVREFEVEGVGRVVARIQRPWEFSLAVTIPMGCTSKGMTEDKAEAIIQALGPKFEDRSVFVPVTFEQNQAWGKVCRLNGRIESTQVNGLQGGYVLVYLKKAEA